MRLPAMYFFLCGQRFSFSQSGISETSSRERTRTLSVLAIIQFRNVARSQYGCIAACQHNKTRKINRTGRPGKQFRSDEVRSDGVVVLGVEMPQRAHFARTGLNRAVENFIVAVRYMPEMNQTP